jgi:hypothetical protein
LIHVLEVNTNTISDIDSQFKIIAKWM